jgi:hypothetical protein
MTIVNLEKLLFSILTFQIMFLGWDFFLINSDLFFFFLQQYSSQWMQDRTGISQFAMGECVAEWTEQARSGMDVKSEVYPSVLDSDHWVDLLTGSRIRINHPQLEALLTMWCVFCCSIGCWYDNRICGVQHRHPFSFLLFLFYIKPLPNTGVQPHILYWSKSKGVLQSKMWFLHCVLATCVNIWFFKTKVEQKNENCAMTHKCSENLYCLYHGMIGWIWDICDLGKTIFSVHV